MWNKLLTTKVMPRMNPSAEYQPSPTPKYLNRPGKTGSKYFWMGREWMSNGQDMIIIFSRKI